MEGLIFCIAVSIPTNRNRLLKIWKEFVEHKRQFCEQTTIDQVYGGITVRLQLLPYSIESSQDVLDWLRETKAERKSDSQSDKPRWSYDTQRRTLEKLKAATAWAKQSGKIRRDPFENVANYPERSQNADSYRAFTPAERTAILNASKLHLKPYQSRWVHVLFCTGCRPSELRALKREHWSGNGKQLRIVSAFPHGAIAPKDTKNRKTTPDYPVNAQLRALLTKSLEGTQGNIWIFREPNDTPFNYARFQARTWKPFLQQLTEMGRIAFPLSQYHARHTWITEALKTMSIADVAYLARTSPAVIHKHYGDRSRDLSIPEI